jgi:hypothetical protein
MKVFRRWAALLCIVSIALATTPARGQIPNLSTWSARYGGAAAWSDASNAVAVSPDGTRVFVTGAATESGFYADYRTTAYDAVNGAVVWTALYDGSSTFPGEGATAVTTDGTRVYVTGTSATPGPYGLDIATIAYNAATGSQVWAARYDGSSSDRGNAIIVTGSRVYVGGDTIGPDGSSDMAVIAYDAATGTQQWASRWNASYGPDSALALAIHPNGSLVYATGEAWASPEHSTDLGVAAFTAVSGALLWTAAYNGAGSYYDVGRAIAVHPNGTRVYVTGSFFGASANNDLVTLSLPSGTGSPAVWTKTYNNGADDVGQSIVVTSSRIYVSGGSYGGVANNRDMIAIAYDGSGTQQWLARYNGTSGTSSTYDDLKKMVLNPTGTRLYMAGTSLAYPNQDFALVAVDTSNGAETWHATYDGPVHGVDVASGLAVTPDGQRIFVTGSSASSATNAYDTDYATVAYCEIPPQISCLLLPI